MCCTRRSVPEMATGTGQALGKSHHGDAEVLFVQYFLPDRQHRR